MDPTELREVILGAIEDWYESEPGDLVIFEDTKMLELALAIAARLEEGEG